MNPNSPTRNFFDKTMPFWPLNYKDTGVKNYKHPFQTPLKKKALKIFVGMLIDMVTASEGKNQMLGKLENISKESL